MLLAANRLYDRLKASAALDLFVAGRIYPMRGPDKPTYPIAVYSVVSELPQWSFDGPSCLARVRMQIDCYAVKRHVAFEIADAAQAAATGSDDYTFRSISGGRRESYDSTVRVHQVSLDIVVWSVETPTSP